MLAARLFQLSGRVLAGVEIEWSLAIAVSSAAMVAAASGFLWTAAVLAGLSVLSCVWLPTLQTAYPATGYGAHSRLASPLGAPAPPLRHELRVDRGTWFRDAQGRRVILRGVNLPAKTPVGAATHVPGSLAQADGSFVDCLLPLASADEHFARLRACGLTVARLGVTWEAVEHAGPGIYDSEYLRHLTAVVRAAARHGVACVVDPHQDVWSRWTGGDGAPAWTLDLVGFDVAALHASGAAFTHQGHLAESSRPLPCMNWPSNHHRLAAGTMNTIFFAGNDFAPECRIRGRSAQDYLQGHFIDAMARVAETLAAEANVVGFEAMNEPNLGMAGWGDLAEGSRYLRQGPCPTWFQSFQLGVGLRTSVDVYDPSLVRSGRCVLNPDGVRAWKPSHPCVWQQHGVWGLVDGTPVLLKKAYFQRRGAPVDPVQDYFVPFAMRFKSAIAEAVAKGSGQPLAVLLSNPTSFETASLRTHPALPGAGFVWAPHWYDIACLVMKSSRAWVGIARDQGWALPVVFGNARVVREYARQMRLVAQGGSAMNIPTLVGELGVPMDMRSGVAFRTGDFSLQTSAMDTTLRALDMALLSGAIWNYTHDNTNEFGDNWNCEDLSIFSRDQIPPENEDDVFAGMRALPAVARPYASRTAGTPLEMAFDVATRTFTFRFRHDPSVAAATVLFVPYYQYPQTPIVEISDGSYVFHRMQQTLEYRHDALAGDVHMLRVRPGTNM